MAIVVTKRILQSSKKNLVTTGYVPSKNNNCKDQVNQLHQLIDSVKDVQHEWKTQAVGHVPIHVQSHE